MCNQAFRVTDMSMESFGFSRGTRKRSRVDIEEQNCAFFFFPVHLSAPEAARLEKLFPGFGNTLFYRRGSKRKGTK